MINKIKDRAKPYTYEAGREALAILIHGFSGTPDDLRNLAKYLAGQGISARSVLLAGHGSHWQDLGETTSYDWWKSVEDEVKAAIGQYQNIFLIGYSFGANLAFDIAARYPKEIAGVVSLGVSVFLKRNYIIKIFLPIFHLFLKHYTKGYIKKNHLIDYEDSGSYVSLPTKSIYEFKNFIKHYTKKELPKVTTPALIIHSKDDAITHPRSSEFVYRKINSQQKDLLLLDDVNHNPLTSKRKDVIYSKIREFILHRV